MRYQVTVDGRPYEVEIADPAARPVVAVVNGEAGEVWPTETPTPATAPSSPPPPTVPTLAAPPAVLATVAPREARDTAAVLAPLPGVVLSVAVSPGSELAAGDEVAVIEAMKMRNVVRAPRAGTVAAVHVAAGEHVRHHQALITYQG